MTKKIINKLMILTFICITTCLYNQKTCCMNMPKSENIQKPNSEKQTSNKEELNINTLDEFEETYGESIFNETYTLENLDKILKELKLIKVETNLDTITKKDFNNEIIRQKIACINTNNKIEEIILKLKEETPILAIKKDESSINNESIKKLINELREKISKNFDLKIIIPCPGTIEILVNGYEKDPQSKRNKQEYQKIFNPIKILPIETYTKISLNTFQNEKIVFTGLGTSDALNEYSILTETLSQSNFEGKNITIQDIHLIDIDYNSFIPNFNNNNFLKMLIKNHYYFNEYNYLLNGKKAIPIKLFLHSNTKSYLECLSKCNLDKANCISAFNVLYFEAAQNDFINLILNGINKKCLFFSNSPKFSNVLLDINKDIEIKDIYKKMQSAQKNRLISLPYKAKLKRDVDLEKKGSSFFKRKIKLEGEISPSEQTYYLMKK